MPFRNKTPEEQFEKAIGKKQPDPEKILAAAKAVQEKLPDGFEKEILALMDKGKKIQEEARLKIEEALGITYEATYEPESFQRAIEKHQSFSFSPVAGEEIIFSQNNQAIATIKVDEIDLNGRFEKITVDGETSNQTTIFVENSDDPGNILIIQNTGSRLEVRVFEDGVTISGKQPARKEIPNISLEEKKIRLLDGEGAQSLFEALETQETAFGKITAATDIGIDPKKPKSEDRILIYTYNLDGEEEVLIAAVDGIGGNEDGDKAAEIISRELTRRPRSIKESCMKADKKIKAGDLCYERAGACLAGGRVFEQDSKTYFEGFSNGNTGWEIRNANGEIKAKSEEQSQVEFLVTEGKITPDEALYHEQRNIISSKIGGSSAASITKYPPVELESGDRILAWSDGIRNNLTSDETWELIEGKSAKEAMQIISKETDARMKNCEHIKTNTANQGGREKMGEYSDGYKSEPTCDNRAFAIYDIALQPKDSCKTIYKITPA